MFWCSWKTNTQNQMGLFIELRAENTWQINPLSRWSSGRRRRRAETCLCPPPGGTYRVGTLWIPSVPSGRVPTSMVPSLEAATRPGCAAERGFRARSGHPPATARGHRFPMCEHSADGSSTHRGPWAQVPAAQELVGPPGTAFYRRRPAAVRRRFPG